jgi:penicillin-binding protein 2
MRHANPFDVVPVAGLGRSKVIRRFRSFEYSDTTLDATETDSPTLKHQVQPIRLRVVMVFFYALIVTLLGRGVWLQVFHGGSMRDAAEQNRIRIYSTPAPRGIIYDRHSAPLVENVPEFTLGIIPKDLPNDSTERSAVLQKIAGIAKIPITTITKSLAAMSTTSIELCSIQEHVQYQEALSLKVRLQDEPAVQVNASPRRHYIADQSLSPVLGYTGKFTDAEWQKLVAERQTEYRFIDVIGKTGLEASYEAQLRGSSEKSSVEVNAQRREQKVITSEPAVPGQNLVTTLDAGLQQVVAKSLNESVQRTHSTGGAAVAIDPRTGGILAIVSTPTYNSNDFVTGLTADAYKALTSDPRRPLFFRAIAGEYPSGSTIKPVIATAALDQGVITPQTTVLSTGGIKIDKWFFPDWKAGGHGVTNVTKAIAESVNTFFYTIGGGTETFPGLGIDRMTEYARAFGFGAPTGIDIPGEQSGFLPSKAWKEQTKGEPWYIGDTYHFAIGQGDLLVTPLQMALSTATIANGGTLYKPHLIQALQGENGEVRPVTPTELRSPVQHRDAIATVRLGMRQAVTSGSARALQSLGVPAAGKTGTAQYGTESKTHAWFIGFAPYENPTIAFAVIVEGGGEGGVAALPVAKAGMQYWLAHEKTPVKP